MQCLESGIDLCRRQRDSNAAIRMASRSQGDCRPELSIKVRDISISRSNVSNLQLCRGRTLRGSKQRTATLMLRRESPTIMKLPPANSSRALDSSPFASIEEIPVLSDRAQRQPAGNDLYESRRHFRDSTRVAIGFHEGVRGLGVERGLATRRSARPPPKGRGSR
jgi:hypothetical protein